MAEVAKYLLTVSRLIDGLNRFLAAGTIGPDWVIGIRASQEDVVNVIRLVQLVHGQEGKYPDLVVLATPDHQDMSEPHFI
jgi:hypothetical protein